MGQLAKVVDLASRWSLDPSIHYLNHGSYGACPTEVLEAQAALRARMERQPVQFLSRDLEGLLDEARASLAQFLHAEPEELVFVPNATHAVNAVVHSLELDEGDEVLTLNHAYNACRNALEHAAGKRGVRVVVAQVPFPLSSPDEAASAILNAVSPRTRLVMVDHVTSPTGLVLPVADILRALAERGGVEVLVDGAHAPGMLPLNLRSLGATYYAGNCHKWLCAPKGAGFLFVRKDRQRRIHPPVVSHGANSERRDRSRFLLEFDWTGTDDPTPYLCIPHALRVMGGLWPGGWSELMRHNRDKALAARDALCRALDIQAPCPDTMVGSLAAVPLPDSPKRGASREDEDPLQLALLKEFHLEVPVKPWPAPPQRLLRISAQAYNRGEQYEALAKALGELLQREGARA